MLNGGMNLAETQHVTPLLLEAKPPALCSGTLGQGPAMGPQPGKRTSAPQPGSGIEAEVNKGRSRYV